jgi:hypothetical protein
MGPVPGGILFDPLDSLSRWQNYFSSERFSMSRTSRSDIRAVTLLVFLSRSAGTRIIAPNFRGCSDGLGGFGLRRAGLILQIALLPGLLAFNFARDGRQMMRFAFAITRSSRRGASHGVSRIWPGSRRFGTLFQLLRLSLVDLDVE